MNHCPNCGQSNAQMSNFCRFCGTNFSLAQNAKPNASAGNFDFAPPRPYVWKTDEFQVSEAQARKNKPINRVQPLPPPPNAFATMPPQSLAYQQPQNMAYGYRCPMCATQLLPKITRRISTAGWIVFAVLMVTFFPLFWIGLLIKEDVRICSVCNAQIG